MTRLTRALAIAGLLPLLAACPNRQTTALQVATAGHDALAQAQDLEAQLCLGVPTAVAAATLPDPTHCTTPVAATVGLTDAKHKQIVTTLASAWDYYRTATRAAQAAGTADFSNMNTALQSVLSILATLQQAPPVTALATAVQAAKK